MPEVSGSFDDVAAAAVSGVAPFVIAVCEDLGSVARLGSWLDTAVPALAARQLRGCRAQDLEEQVAVISSSAATAQILVVEDAAAGDDAEVSRRWSGWNGARDRLRVRLDAPGSSNAIVLLVTRRRMPEIAAVAPDLLSVSQVITASEEPFVLRPDQEKTVAAFQRARQTLERRYCLSTEEVVRRLFEREPVSVPEFDLNRWKAVAEALREIVPA